MTRQKLIDSLEPRVLAALTHAEDEVVSLAPLPLRPGVRLLYAHFLKSSALLTRLAVELVVKETAPRLSTPLNEIAELINDPAPFHGAVRLALSEIQ